MTARSVTIDCAAWGARHYFKEAEEWDARAREAEAIGDPRANIATAHAEALRTAGRNALAAAGLPDADTIEPEMWRDLTPKEQQQRERDALEGERQQAMMFRAQRDATLTQSDWTVLPGSPLTATERGAWEKYRQALRDLPTTTDPLNPVWPTPPKK